MSTLLVFAQQRWDLAFSRPQHLAVRLARRHRIVFVEPPLPCDDGPRLERLRPCDNVLVVRPHARADQHGAAAQALERALRRARTHEDLLVWICTPARPLLPASLRPRALIVDCADAPPSLPLASLADAQLVLAAGPTRYRALRALHDNVHLVPNAVDAAHFAPARVTARYDEYLAAEALQGQIPAPRLGWFGAIDERIDLGLVAAVADARPDWHFVLAGAVCVDDLPQRPNLHWLGEQPYRRLPALVAGWDVCLLPFATGEGNRFLSPAQTLEYLAAEKPVVSTPLADVVALHADVVRIASDAAAFVAACDVALHEAPEDRDERLHLSAASVAAASWDDVARGVLERIDEALDRIPALPAPRRGASERSAVGF
jgi:glycosyltransferase involved in cell wall biosynthesis